MTGRVSNGAQGSDSSKLFRYDYEIDREGDSPQMRVVRLVGPDKRVLELGCGSGPMSKLFRDQGCSVVGVELDPDAAARAREHCERVIVGDLDQMDLVKALEGETFDVVVATDLLEHLKEPGQVLRSVRPLLREHGHVVALVPNVAHASVRLALLTGQFPYSDLGLLDRTHLRFYTRESLQTLFEESGYAIVALDRNLVTLEHAEVPFDREKISSEILASITAQPEALTYQFIVVAYPQGSVENHVLGFQLKELSLTLEVTAALNAELRAAKDATEREAAKLRESVELVSAQRDEINQEAVKLRQLNVEQRNQIDMLRSEMESLAVAKAEADNLAARGIQQGELNAAERAKVQEAIAEQALTALRAELAAMTVELEAARADTATACRQRDAMRIALRRAGAKRTPVHAELEAARAQAALTEYWRNRYEGLRARMRGILERFGIIWLARLAPSPIRHFIRERMFGPGRA